MKQNSAPWPADRIERWPTSKLLAYPRNARTHSEGQVAQIAASMREFGWTMPILTDEAGTVIAGHGRLLAAAQLKINEVPVMVANGWTEAQKRAYRLADNQLSMNAGWDMDFLKLELADLGEMDFNIDLIGFDDQMLAAIEATGAGVGLTDPDDVPETPVNPIALTGDLWRLGKHRLVCGDATEAADVQTVLGGVQPHLMVTDRLTGLIMTRIGGTSALGHPREWEIEQSGQEL